MRRYVIENGIPRSRSLLPFRGLAGASLLLALAAVPLVLGATGCPEQPVLEKVEFRFLPEGNVVVSSQVDFAQGDVYKENPLVQQRLQESRQATLEGRDAWVQRFGSLNADAEQVRWEKGQGQLLRVSHRAFLQNPENLGRFFSDTPIVVNYTASEGWAELSIYPGGPWRATQEEQQRLGKIFETWTRDVAKYLVATKRLYEYLDRNPSRARICIGAVFEDLLTKEARTSLESPQMPEEDDLVTEVQDSISTVLEQFLVPKNESLSADELSHLVYDPFPAPIAVRVPGKILEAQGFAAGGAGGGLTIPGLGLWDALRALEGHWVSPDPLVAYYTHGKSTQAGKRTFDLDGFLAKRRTYIEPPSAYDVKKAVEALLTPAPVYRVRWTSPKPGKREGGFDWDQFDRPESQGGQR